MEQRSLEVRLATLERRASRLRVLALLAVALAAVTPASLLLRGEPTLSEGRLWLARDETGRLRAMFGVTTDGVGLTMYDSTGQLRLDLGLAPGGVPGLILLSERGEPVATLNLAQDGNPVLRLADFRQRTRLEMRAATGTTTAPLAPDK
jgi:hypothetical protein